MSEEAIKSYRDRILDNAKIILRNVVTNSAPVFGVISPPFTDVQPFCRSLVRYMFEERSKIKYGDKVCKYHLYGFDPTLPEVKYDPRWTEDKLRGIVFKDGEVDEFFIEGVLLMHLELVSDAHWEIILNEADRRGMFILYNSPHQKERGQYISAGLLSDEDALAHFEEPGYIHKGEIPPERVPDIPHNVEAIRIVEQELFNRGSGDITQNAEVLLNWREFIGPYVKGDIVRNRLKILFNKFLDNHNDSREGYFHSIRGDDNSREGEREKFKDSIGCILRSIVFTSTSAPNEFLEKIWETPADKYLSSNDVDSEIKRLRMDALKKLRDNRIIVLQDGRYNTTPYVAEVLKKYFRYEVLWHLKEMTRVIEALRDHLDTMVECEFPLNLIEEGIRSAVSFYKYRDTYSGPEGNAEGLKDDDYPTLTVVHSKAELDAHASFVFNKAVPETLKEGPMIGMCVDLLESRNLLYAGTPSYGRCLSALVDIKDDISEDLRKRVLKLNARYNIYYNRANLAASTAAIRALIGVVEEEECKFIAAELQTCTQLRVDFPEIKDMPERRKSPGIIYERLNNATEHEIAHVRAYNYFVLKALDNLTLLSKGQVDEQYGLLFEALAHIESIIADLECKGSACDLEFRVIRQQCQRRRANELKGKKDKGGEVYRETTTDLEDFKKTKMIYPGLYLKANMENSWFYMASNDTFHARSIYDSVLDLLATGMLAGEREFNLANYYERTGQLYRARDHYLSSIEHYTREGLIDFAVSAKCSLMSLFAKMNDYDSIRGLRVKLESIVKEEMNSRFNDALLRRIQRTLYDTYF